MRFVFILAIVLLLSPLAFAQDYNSYSTLKLDYTFSSQFTLQSEKTIDNFQLTINALPLKERNQNPESISVRTVPEATYEIKDSEILVTWKNVKPGNFNVQVTSPVLMTNSIIPIYSSESINKNQEVYTEETENIDVTPEIRAKAQELTKGMTDQYEMIFALGTWVKTHINYDLNTLPAGTVQKASWVFENRVGVCNEFTNLFISLSRSLGIPARYVYGMAYSNIEKKWVSHAWAEVYFNEGWVPVDATFGQLGWVDPSHLKLHTDKDSGTPTVIYKWTSGTATLSDKTLEVSTSVSNYGSNMTSPVSLELRPMVDKLGESSFIPLELRIKNNQNYYVPEMFFLSKAPSASEDNLKYSLLKPGELKKLYWVVEGPKNLEPGFLYTNLVEAEDLYGSSDQTNLTFSSGYTRYSQAEANTLIQYVQNGNQTEDFASLECSSSDYYYMYQPVNINCNLKNNLNKKLKAVSVCIDTSCLSLDLNANEDKEFNLTLQNLTKGLNQINIEASYAAYKTKTTLATLILEDPDLKVTQVDLPETISYNEKFELSFILILKAPAYDIDVSLGNQKITSLDKLESSKKVVIYTSGKDLIKAKNRLLQVSFTDKNGRNYKTEQQLETTVVNIPFFIRILYLIGLM